MANRIEHLMGPFLTTEQLKGTEYMATQTEKMEFWAAWDKARIDKDIKRYEARAWLELWFEELPADKKKAWDNLIRNITTGKIEKDIENG